MSTARKSTIVNTAGRMPTAPQAAGMTMRRPNVQRLASSSQTPRRAVRSIHFSYFARAPLRRSSQARPRERAAR